MKKQITPPGKQVKPHRFTPSPHSQAREPWKFCNICSRQKRHRLHQPWLWRIMHRETWRNDL